jgi:serine/threonine-protein kinase PpkA
MSSNVRIPGYKILSQLGKGGMSSVYLAEQLSFGRLVALKVMTANLAETEHFGHRFLREARIASHLSHPNIVSVFDTGSVDGNYFLAMEHLSGEDLRKRIGSGIALLETLDITIALADAIDYASGQGVIHRDIKPANIMFREDGSLAVVDFGIARDINTETQVTQIGTVMGTPHYMSPEQSSGLELDSRSDLYSVGIVFFELLSGHVPFTADSAAAVGIKHITAEIPQLPEETQIFQGVINRILAKDPDDRYQSGEEFAADIEELRMDLPEALATTILISQGQAGPGGTASSRLTGSRARRRKSTTRQDAPESPKTNKMVAIVATLATLSIGVLFYYLVLPNFIAPVKPAESGGALVESAEELIGEVEAEVKIVPALAEPVTPVISEEQSKLENIARKYIATARTALSEGRLDSAKSYIELTQALELDSRDIQEALTAVIVDHERMLMERSSIDDLIATFSDQLANNELFTPSSANAYLSLSELRRLSPDHPKLAKMQREVNASASRAIRQRLSRGQFVQTEKDIKLWSALAPDEMVSGMERELADTRREEQEGIRRKKELHAEAIALKSQAGNSESANRGLISTYQQLLSLDSTDKVAKKGLEAALAFELEIAREALKSGELIQTRSAVNYLNNESPGMNGLAATSAELARLESRRKDAEADRVAAINIIDNLQDNDLTAKASPAMHQRQADELIRAYGAAFRARRLDPELPGLDDTLTRIDREYTVRFSSYASSESAEIAGTYARALSESGFTSAHILELIDEFNVALKSIEKKRRKAFPSF